MDTNGENSKVWGVAFLGCLEERRRAVYLLLQETGLRRDRTTQRGRFHHFLRVLVRTRAGRAQLPGHQLEAMLDIANRVVEGCRTPDEAMVCSGEGANCREPEPS